MVGPGTPDTIMPLDHVNYGDFGITTVQIEQECIDQNFDESERMETAV